VKNENALQSMKSKFANHVSYRNQMVSTTDLILKSICLRQ